MSLNPASHKDRRYLRIIKERIKTKKISSSGLDFREKHKNSIKSPFVKRKTKKSINMGNTMFQTNNYNLPQLNSTSPQGNTQQIGGMNSPPILESPMENQLFRNRFRVKSPEIKVNSPQEARKRSRIGSIRSPLVKPTRRARNKFSTTRQMAKVRNLKQKNQRFSKIYTKTIAFNK
mmetsp:Transcript_35277/g.34937  ORF Transcript_35277/g.34937 Transcript_35277/m.34937 type:complete len:176 (-) Transcript_35277:5-532(-)